MNPDARLKFSADTILFDTIFSDIGSVTERLIVINPNKNAVKISRIQLPNGSGPYQLIINGQATNSISNLELRGGDSIYILVKVKIDPTNEENPFLIKDSVVFE